MEHFEYTSELEHFELYLYLQIVLMVVMVLLTVLLAGRESSLKHARYHTGSLFHLGFVGQAI